MSLSTSVPMALPSPVSRTPLQPADLEAAGRLWRADALAQQGTHTWPTGHAALDAQLPGGGWPVSALTEVLLPDVGRAEWHLLLPALASAGHGPLVLVGTPHLPFAPALAAQGLDVRRLLRVQADSAAARLWACEQTLRCPQVSALVAWLPQVRPEGLRRLHALAQQSKACVFVMRPLSAQTQASPAVLRLVLSLGGSAMADPPALQVQVLKRRGPPLVAALQLPARQPRLAALLQACAEGSSGPEPASAMLLPGSHRALDCPRAAAG